MSDTGWMNSETSEIYNEIMLDIELYVPLTAQVLRRKIEYHVTTGDAYKSHPLRQTIIKSFLDRVMWNELSQFIIEQLSLSESEYHGC
jgi:hypothetical protein